MINNKIEKIEDVWFASEAYASKSDKVKVYESITILFLNYADYTLRIKEPNLFLKFSAVSSVKLTRTKLNWKTYLKFNTIIVIVGLAAKWPFLYILVNLIIGNALGVFIGWYLIPWIEITYQFDGAKSKVYINDGSYRGYGGMFGGTVKIYRKLKKAIDNTQ